MSAGYVVCDDNISTVLSPASFLFLTQITMNTCKQMIFVLGVIYLTICTSLPANQEGAVMNDVTDATDLEVLSRDKRSTGGTHTINGAQCRNGSTCDYHGERYMWCYTSHADDWDYCCINECNYRGYSDRWCTIGSTWHYCSAQNGAGGDNNLCDL